MSLYDAYLPRIAKPEAVGRVSSFGWSAGFLGGIAAILVCLAWLAGTEISADPHFVAVFTLVAALFAAAAVPALLGMRHVPAGPPAPEPAARGRSAASRVAATVRAWRTHRNAVKFLAALYLINDALVTIGFFAGIYFRDQFGLGLVELLQLALLYQVLAIPGTLLFGRFADRVSPHTAIYTTLVIWVASVALMASGAGAWVPYAVVVLFAVVFGSTQALLRGAYALIVPVRQAGEFFGFNALAGRLSAAAGPLLYGAVSAATGSQRAALLSVLVFLIGGATVLSTVRLDEATDAPADATRDAA
jgi:UMF1 family MFS transporter